MTRPICGIRPALQCSFMRGLGYLGPCSRLRKGVPLGRVNLLVSLVMFDPSEVFGGDV